MAGPVHDPGPGDPQPHRDSEQAQTQSVLWRVRAAVAGRRPQSNHTQHGALSGDAHGGAQWAGTLGAGGQNLGSDGVWGHRPGTWLRWLWVLRANLVVLESRTAVVMYSDMRFSISATRIHARPWKAGTPFAPLCCRGHGCTPTPHRGPEPHLGPRGADVLHALDAAHTVVGHLAAGQADVVPEAALPVRAEPAGRPCWGTG